METIILERYLIGHHPNICPWIGTVKHFITTFRIANRNIYYRTTEALMWKRPGYEFIISKEESLLLQTSALCFQCVFSAFLRE